MKGLWELLCDMDLGLASQPWPWACCMACLDPLKVKLLPTRMLKGPAFSGHPGDWPGWAQSRQVDPPELQGPQEMLLEGPWLQALRGSGSCLLLVGSAQSLVASGDFPKAPPWRPGREPKGGQAGSWAGDTSLSGASEPVPRTLLIQNEGTPALAPPF